jgi:acyl-CoA thioesterase
MMSDPTSIARQVGETMFAVDVASKDTMGMALLACEPGRAVMRMTVKALHLNGHHICHGGFIFTLADSTFAFACNNRNNLSVALDTSINFIKPVHIGDVLIAEARELHNGKSTGLYQIEIYNQKEHLVAQFKGLCYRTGKPCIK